MSTAVLRRVEVASVTCTSCEQRLECDAVPADCAERHSRVTGHTGFFVRLAAEQYLQVQP